MAIRETDSGKVMIPDNALGKAGIVVAETGNKTGNFIREHWKGLGAFTLGAALVAGTLVPWIRDTGRATRETAAAMADGAGDLTDLLPDACIGDACTDREGAVASTTVPSVETGPVSGSPIVGPETDSQGVAVESVTVPAGAGGLAVARLCLGLSVDAPLSPAINQQWDRMQASNAAAVADGLTAGEQLAC